MPKNEDDNEEEWHFEGFVTPKYTATPDQIFDELLEPGRLTEAELRVLLYIVRRTFGWKKDSDAISLSQLSEGIVKRDGTRVDWGAGVGRKAASRASQALEAKGIIRAERVSNQPGKAPDTTIYTLVTREERQYPKDTASTSTQYPKDTTPPSIQYPKDTEVSSSKTLDTVSQSYPQETITTNNKQQTEEEAAKTEFDEAPRYSPWIAATITDYSREFNDLANATTNVDQALRLWRSSNMGEEAFVRLLQQAKEATRKAQGSRGGVANKMDRLLQEARRLTDDDSHAS